MSSVILYLLSLKMVVVIRRYYFLMFLIMAFPGMSHTAKHDMSTFAFQKVFLDLYDCYFGKFIYLINTTLKRTLLPRYMQNIGQFYLSCDLWQPCKPFNSISHKLWNMDISGFGIVVLNSFLAWGHSGCGVPGRKTRTDFQPSSYSVGNCILNNKSQSLHKTLYKPSSYWVVIQFPTQNEIISIYFCNCYICTWGTILSFETETKSSKH